MKRLLGLACGLLVLAGCSGSDGPSAATVGVPDSAASVGGTVGTPSADATSAEQPASPDAAVDCDAIRDDRFTAALVGLQLMVQLRDQESIDLMKRGVIKLDAPLLLEYLALVKPMGGRDYPGFGDPAESIAKYTAATEAAQDLLAIEGPVPQAELDAFRDLVGDPATFITGQAAIGAAIGDNCG